MIVDGDADLHDILCADAGEGMKGHHWRVGARLQNSVRPTVVIVVEDFDVEQALATVAVNVLLIAP